MRWPPIRPEKIAQPDLSNYFSEDEIGQVRLSEFLADQASPQIIAQIRLSDFVSAPPLRPNLRRPRP